jgi:hypothetical protein
MLLVKDAHAGFTVPDSPSQFLDILSPDGSGNWVLNLPPLLREYQGELQALLRRVFEGRQSQDNLELAQQLTINWCLSKYRKIGLSIESNING